MVGIDITYSQRDYCNRAGNRRLEAVLDDCRSLYNAALQERRDAYRQHGHTVTWVDQNRSLTDIRADWPEREGAVDRRVQPGVLRRLDRAYQSLFRRVKAGQKGGFPRFQSWHRYRTIGVEAPTAPMLRVRADGLKAWVKVKGLPTVIIRPSRPLPPAAALKSLRLVSRRVGVMREVKNRGKDKLAWDVDLGFRVEREPLPKTPVAVGIDMGVTDRLALSNGELISGAGRPGPESSDSETRICGIPTIPQEGAAPHMAETPECLACRQADTSAAPHMAETPASCVCYLRGRQAAPHMAETPGLSSGSRPTVPAAPHMAETPLGRDWKGRPLRAAPHMAETPLTGANLSGANLAAPHMAETPYLVQSVQGVHEAAPHMAETPRDIQAIRCLEMAAPHMAETPQLALEQAIARCLKRSRRQRKLYRQLARLRHSERIRNRNECHRITTDIVRRFGRIAMEKLAVQRMLKSAKGTIENPGVNVAAKAGLNRSIQAQSWGLIRQQLSYKAEWAGREFVEVDPRYTSRLCSRCGLEGERKGKAFTCPTCGLQWDVDLNAAVNILRRAFGPTGGYVRRGSPGGDLPEQAYLMPAETQPDST